MSARSSTTSSVNCCGSHRCSTARPSPRWATASTATSSGSDPSASARSAAAAALAAASQPGAHERIVHLSFGDFTGSDYLSQVVSDVIIHSWDLARAVGADDRLDPALVTFVDGFLSPQIDAWRNAGAFGPAVDVGCRRESAGPTPRPDRSIGHVECGVRTRSGANSDPSDRRRRFRSRANVVPVSP